jgi:hypothetical protein
MLVVGCELRYGTIMALAFEGTSWTLDSRVFERGGGMTFVTVSVGANLMVVKTTHISNRWQLLFRLCNVKPRLRGDRGLVRAISPRVGRVVVFHGWVDEWDVGYQMGNVCDDDG